jgi:REP element-mobilizing transposase RayT
MARPIRVELEGAVYHVTARGNERKRIYRADEDRVRFLETLEEAVQEHGLRVHAYCLMPNHFHLLVETPRGNLSRAIGWLQTAYPKYRNRNRRLRRVRRCPGFYRRW